MAVGYVIGLIACACAVGGNSIERENSGFREDYQFYPEVNGWLKLHKFPVPWSDARLACHLEGSQLASPVDEDLYMVMDKLVKEANKTIFTGVKSMATVQDYMALDGTPLMNMPVKWAVGQPDNKDNAERCLAMMPDGMADVDCSVVYHFICFKKKVEGETFAKNECGTVADGYVRVKETGSCYKLHSTRATWYRGHSVCTAEGGHLAIINSEQEAQILADMAAKLPNKEETLDVHVGFYYWPINTRSWPDMKPIFISTVEGKSLEEAGYNHFGEKPQFSPSQGIGVPEPCGSLLLRKNELQGLSNVYCLDSFPFICEIDAKTSE